MATVLRFCGGRGAGGGGQPTVRQQQGEPARRAVAGRKCIADTVHEERGRRARLVGERVRAGLFQRDEADR